MGTTKWCRNVHTSLRQDRDQDPLFPIVPVPYLVPSSVPVLGSVNKSGLLFHKKMPLNINGA